MVDRAERGIAGEGKGGDLGGGEEKGREGRGWGMDELGWSAGEGIGLADGRARKGNGLSGQGFHPIGSFHSKSAKDVFLYSPAEVFPISFYLLVPSFSTKTNSLPI